MKNYFLQVHKVPKVNNTIPDVKPEDVEALAKAVTGNKKRKIGFAENVIDKDDDANIQVLKETDAAQQKVIVELESDVPTPKKKKFKKKKKKVLAE